MAASATLPFREADATFASEPVEGFRIDNRFVKELPGDRSGDRSVRAVEKACFSSVLPARVSAPKLVSYSEEVAALLGIRPELVLSEKFVEVLGGNTLIPGMDPFAACYGGHQFGGWAGQLGDGRAITLCELLSPSGERFELQLKGAGRTPYSRAGDGRAVLRSSIREFLASEAMHHLGVPTTRALALVTTGDRVVRDMLYDGNPREEAGAIVCRVARSFLRFGNFELFGAREDLETLKRLADHSLTAYFPDLGVPGGAATYGALFHEICRRTALTVAHWMRVGFVHGVMNTDNMSLLGITFDYGPYAFLDDYDAGHICNHSDSAGRYSFENQVPIAEWNLAALAQALTPFVEVDQLRETLALFVPLQRAHYLDLMRRRLGLFTAGDEDEQLIERLLKLMQHSGSVDYSLFFRRLGDAPLDEALQRLRDDFVDRAGFDAWAADFRARCAREALAPDERRARMAAVNPKYVLRNYLAQQAIEAAEQGDYGPVRELHEVLSRPFDEQPGKERYAQRPPDWGKRLAISCSS